MNSRAIALRLLRQFDKKPGDLSYILDRGLRSATIDHRDRRLVHELVFGVVRRRITLDFIIDAFLADKRVHENKELIRIIELGAYQILYMDKIPHHAAVNEAVKLAKDEHTTLRFSGIVNGILRSIIGSLGKLPVPGPETDLVTRLSVEFSHPQWLVRRWLDGFGLAKTKKLLAFDNQVPDIFLRRKLRGVSRPAFESDARPLVETASGFNNLYYRLAAKGMAPDEIMLFKLGDCTVQAPSSGWAVAMLGVQSGDHCLDVCCAPGGKTTLLSELAGENGSVVAADAKPGRMRRVAETIERMKLSNVYLIAADALQTPIAGMFDKVLLDAPCSGTGVVQRHPDSRWTTTAEDIADAALLQAKLLDAAALHVSPGGTLVYATCSLEPEENEKQVSAFLLRNKNFSHAHAPAVVPAQYVDYEGSLRITPFEHGMDGMFAARLVRTAG